MLDDVINDVTRPGSKIREEELFPQVGDHRVKKSAQSDKKCRRRSILKKTADKPTHPATDIHAV